MKPPIIVREVQDLASGVLSLEVDYDFPLRLCQVLLHASVAITETVSVYYDAGVGSNYDVPLDSTDLSSQQDYIFRPAGMCVIGREDKIRVECTNSNGTGKVYVTVICVPA